MTVYAIHGLRIRCERALDATPVDHDDNVDLDVRFGDVVDATADDPAGTVLARLAYEDLPAYTAVQHERGYVMRFPNFADVVFDAAVTTATLHAHAGADADVVPLLVTGAVVAFVLELRGACVLHASGVARDGVAIAFAGPSGAGKTTVAALASLAGGVLIADDVLRVDLTGDRVMCFTGASVLRLRIAVAELADRVPADRRATTPDGRVGLRLGGGNERAVPLEAVVMPRIVPPGEPLAVERVSGADALMALATAPRVVGWLGDQAHRQFAALADLARRVPVFNACVPWAPGEDIAVGTALLDEILAQAR